jgi:hypothetical protein
MEVFQCGRRFCRHMFSLLPMSTPVSTLFRLYSSWDGPERRGTSMQQYRSSSHLKAVLGHFGFLRRGPYRCSF